MGANPRFVGNLRFLAASLAASGQFREARQVAQDLLRLNWGSVRASSPPGMPSRIPRCGSASPIISCWPCLPE